MGRASAPLRSPALAACAMLKEGVTEIAAAWLFVYLFRRVIGIIVRLALFEMMMRHHGCS